MLFLVVPLLLLLLYDIDIDVHVEVKIVRYHQWFMNAIEVWQIDEMSEWICNQCDQSAQFPFHFVSYTSYTLYAMQFDIRTKHKKSEWISSNDIGVNINNDLYSK